MGLLHLLGAALLAHRVLAGGTSWLQLMSGGLGVPGMPLQGKPFLCIPRYPLP